MSPCDKYILAYSQNRVTFACFPPTVFPHRVFCSPFQLQDENIPGNNPLIEHFTFTTPLPLYANGTFMLRTPMGYLSIPEAKHLLFQSRHHHSLCRGPKRQESRPLPPWSWGTLRPLGSSHGQVPQPPRRRRDRRPAQLLGRRW